VVRVANLTIKRWGWRDYHCSRHNSQNWRIKTKMYLVILLWFLALSQFFFHVVSTSSVGGGCIIKDIGQIRHLSDSEPGLSSIAIFYDTIKLLDTAPWDQVTRCNYKKSQLLDKTDNLQKGITIPSKEFQEELDREVRKDYNDDAEFAYHICILNI